ncbi:DUF418 domain-containing protein [Peribacillus sp. NPDC096540]|uniref:DUF418 domain-containing protein n=1 Tax=Peribacillus sp. NPDC096540 TaxID=3390612 RepID=UPI003CFF3CA3
MKRIDELDFLRGFALIGIILINITQMINYLIPEQGTLDYVVRVVLDYGVSQRFFPIFSFLFGIGFYLFIFRANSNGNNGRKLFIRRLLILLAIGFIHHLFQPGEALLPYAICGFILIPFYKFKPKTNFIIAVILLIPSLWIGYVFMIFTMFLLGLCVGQLQVLESLNRYKKTIRRLQMIALAAIPISLYLQYKITSTTGMIDVAGTVGGLAVTLFYVTTLTLLLQHATVKKWLSPLKNIGRMALTNYLMQTFLIICIDSIFNLNNHVHLTTLIMISVGILILQMIYSTIWLKRFKMGPIELLWRIGTYGKVPQHHKKGY